MKITEATTSTDKVVLEKFRIRYGTTWIFLSIKFKGKTTFNIRYPAVLQPNVARYPAGFFEHVSRAEYYWWLQANTVLKDSLQGTNARIFAKRCHNCLQLVSKYYEQLCAGE